MLALPLRDGHGRVFGVLQLINAIDGRGAVRPFSRDEQRLVQDLAAQTTRLPGLDRELRAAPSAPLHRTTAADLLHHRRLFRTLGHR